MNVTNHEFLSVLYRDAPEGSRGHVTGFATDPDALARNPRLSAQAWKGVSVPLPLNGECPHPVGNPDFNNYAAMGIYTSAQRRKSDVAGICAIFVDDVGTKGASKIDPQSLPLAPSWLLETAPGNFQAGYFLQDPQRVDLEQWETVAAAIAEQHGDKSARDLARYMRLPQGANTKAKYGAPFRHVLHTFEADRRYTLAAIAEAFNVSCERRAHANGHDTEADTPHGWIEDILSGDNYHDSLIRMAARCVAKGLSRIETIEMLRGLMERSEHVRDERWRARYDSIEECVSSAIAKGYAPEGDTDETRPARRAFELLPASMALADPTPPRHAVAPLFEVGALVDVFGARESLKSFVVLDWLHSGASGLDWHGRRVEGGTCAYLAGEGLAGIGRRLKALEIVRGPIGELHISRTAAALLDAAMFADVLEALERLADTTGGLRMVAVDTMARFMAPGDENSTRDMGEFVSRLDRLRDRLGCTVIVVCHSGHMAAERQRGSSAWGAALDTSIRVERPNMAEAVVRLTCEKQKDSPRFDPLLLKFAPVELPWLDADGNPSTSLVLDAVEQAGPPVTAAGHGLGKRQRDALRVLGGLYRDHRERVERQGRDRRDARVEIQELRRVANLDRRRWNEISSALAERGLVTVEQGFIYLTETGELAAQ